MSLVPQLSPIQGLVATGDLSDFSIRTSASKLNQPNDDQILIIPELPLARSIQGIYENNNIAKEIVERLNAKDIVRFTSPHSEGYDLEFVSHAKKLAIIANSTKALIYNETFQGDLFTLVFFPKPEHARAIYMASKFSHRNGPGDHFPGCLGIITFQINYQKGLAAIIELQSSINYKNNLASQCLIDDQGKKIQKQYKSWSETLMKLAINYCRSIGVEKFCLRSSDCSSLDYKLDWPVKEASLLEVGNFETDGKLQVELADKICLWNQYRLCD